jgi:predicted metal-binding protein
VKEELVHSLKLYNAALESLELDYSVIPVSVISFSHEVRKACETNVCGNYNKCWTCPPASGSVEENKKYITSFSSAFVFTTKHGLEDSFDCEGMENGKDSHNRLTAKLHEKYGKTNPVYGAGGCSVCYICAFPDICRFPLKKFLSIEAAGINITELAASANLRYNHGENTVTYFSMILF